MKIEHLPINWVNGVKLTKDHFFGNYYNMIEKKEKEKNKKKRLAS